MYICFIRRDSDWGDIRRQRRYSGGLMIEVLARQVGSAMASDGIVTVAVVKMGFIPRMGVLYM